MKNVVKNVNASYVLDSLHYLDVTKIDIKVIKRVEETMRDMDRTVIFKVSCACLGFYDFLKNILDFRMVRTTALSKINKAHDLERAAKAKK